MTSTTTAAPGALTPSDRRRRALRRSVIALLVAGSLFGLYVAFTSAETGPDAGVAETGTDVVGRTFPTSDAASVLSQTQLGIELDIRYTADLVIDGVPIPEEELLRRPELGQVFYSPGPGKVIESLPAGRNCVQALITRVDGTADSTPPHTWCFTVV